MNKFTKGLHVTCNGNTEAVIQDYYSAGMVNVRLWQGFRHVGDVCVPESDLILENPAIYSLSKGKENANKSYG